MFLVGFVPLHLQLSVSAFCDSQSGSKNIYFKNNYLSLNFEKKNHYIHCMTRNSPSTDMKIGLNEKLIPNVLFTKFLGLTVYSTLSWRVHIDHLTTKLSTACFVIRSVKPLMPHMTLLLIYHSPLFLVMSYRIKFGGNFCHSHNFLDAKRVTGFF